MPEKKSVSLIIIILNIIGAMPQLIEAVQAVIDLIRQIRDRRQKKNARRELMELVFSKKHYEHTGRKMSVDENDMMIEQVNAIGSRVVNLLNLEKGE